MEILAKIGWLFGSIVFCGAFFLLSFVAVTPLHVLALGILALCTLLLAFLLFKATHNKKNNYYPMAFHHFNTIGEVCVFDSKGNLLLGSRGPIYLNLSDFARKLFQKIQPNTEASCLQDALDSQQFCDVTVRGGGDGLGQFEKWWNIRVIPHQRHLIIMMVDISQTAGHLSQLQQSYNALEKFIDSAPFGLYYTSRSGHVVGLNATLASWFGGLKEELIGKRVSEILTHNDDHWITLHTDPPLRLYHILNGSANLVFRMGTDYKAMDDIGQTVDTFEKAPLPSIKLNKAGHILNFNAVFRQMLVEYLDISDATLLTDIVAESQKADILKKLQRLFEASHSHQPFEVRFGEDKIHCTAYASRFDKDVALLQFIDISEQKRLEQQFIQSQKMQAVGQLAGGIAHDFNNLLTAMLGFCDLLLQRYIPSDPSYNDVMHIKQNATRAANLVKQLLAFSRQQTLQPKITSITDVLAELTALMRRLIGAGIDLQVIHGRDLWSVKVDGSQLEQVIINLAVNARDAMDQEGKLEIRTSNYHSSKITRLGHDMMPKGDYVLIEIKDTGHGIPPEHLERIFEPFFTTKEVGAGTGLGLSTVYGIVKQTGGFITVESHPKDSPHISISGTTFKIFLPRYQGPDILEEKIKEHQSTDLTGGGRILLVEDEDAVRLFSARALREKGYTVVESASGEDALTLIKQGEKFDLLVTDVVMPKMDGPTLSKKIKDFHPNLKTIFISGYTEDTFRKNLGHDAKIHFLAKPFSLKDLAAKVKDILTPTH